MNLHVDRAEAALNNVLQLYAKQLCSRGPVAANDGLRYGAAHSHVVLDAEGTQHVEGIGAQPDASTKLFQPIGLFKHMYIEAVVGERNSGGHTAKASAHEGDPQRAAHG